METSLTRSPKIPKQSNSWLWKNDKTDKVSFINSKFVTEKIDGFVSNCKQEQILVFKKYQSGLPPL